MNAKTGSAGKASFGSVEGEILTTGEGRKAIEAIAALSDADLRVKVRELSHAVPALQSALAYARREQRRRKRKVGTT